MSNVVPMPRRGAEEPFDQPAPPAPDDAPEDKGRKGGGGKGGRVKRAPEFGPVVPLGTTTVRGATAFVFLDAAGLQSTLTAAQLYGRANISGLFGGEPGRETLKRLWPKRAMLRNPDGTPKLGDDGEPVMAVVGFDPQAAGDALMAACILQGHAAAVEMRRDGIWLHSEGGLLLHCGRRIFVRDEEHRPGFRDGNAIYVSAEERPDPAAEEASAGECQDLEELLGLWRYVAPQAGPAVMMGLVACGILGAALPWRPHVFVRAGEGSGKSSLNRLISAACGVGEASTDTSEPALRRQADMRSVLISLDEREANAPGVGRVVDLMRGASDGRGAKVMRASPEGGGTDTFIVAGCFLMTAVTQPKLTAADASRITFVELLPLEKDSSEEVAAATVAMKALYPRLVTRLIGRIAQWRENWRLAREAALALDATSRNADQIGALLAGWRVLVSDAVMTPAEAAEHMGLLAAFVTTKAEAAEIGTAQRVLQHMLASRVQVGMRHGDSMTVQNALSETWRAYRAYGQARANLPNDPSTKECHDKAEEWRRKLGAVGLRFDMGGNPDSWPGSGPRTPGVWVRNGSPSIEAVFAGTDWAGGAWEGPLRDLPGAQKSRTSMKFPGGGQGRACLVALDQLGLEDAPG